MLKCKLQRRSPPFLLPLSVLVDKNPIPVTHGLLHCAVPRFPQVLLPFYRSTVKEGRIAGWVVRRLPRSGLELRPADARPGALTATYTGEVLSSYVEITYT